MYLRKSLYLSLLLFALATQQGMAQITFTPIEGVINKYTPVEAILASQSNNVDSVIVSDLTGFDVGDTVMLYCVQGSAIVTEPNIDFPDVGADSLKPRNTGRYAFLIVSQIDVPTRVVIFNNTVKPDIGPLGPGEVAQLIKVRSYRNARVTSNGLTAPAWDGSTGGVVTMFVHVLKLEGDIDVTGKGFRGASESRNYLEDCSVDNMSLLDSMFYDIEMVFAGLKGEGSTDTTFSQMRGRAKNIIGGGGGNGKFSGGGGGSNWNSGGKGGNESDECSLGVIDPGGQGGYNLDDAKYYSNYGDYPVILDRWDRIFFGGGGGTGTMKSGLQPTDGGNGGGLVVIIADSIIGSDTWSITANGADVTNLASNAGGGGGGGGGGILLDVNGYRSDLKLFAEGGDGGSTSGTFNTGPGGGGGGGVYWISGDKANHPELTDSRTKAVAGRSQSALSFGAGDGNRPGLQERLMTPIRGFIFNPVPSEFWVCSDVVPDPLLANEPKGGGGSGSYDYLWVDSSSTQNDWLEAPGINDLQNYTFPGILSDTTYFRRIVYDQGGLLLPDTSFRIAVYVHPEIVSNTISAPDTVCSENSPELFLPSGTIGGGPTGGSYTYLWQKDEGTGYVTADGQNNQETYQAPKLTLTTDFARIAMAGVCVDTSNKLLVKVWENHTDFQIKDNDTICYNTMPDPLTSLTGAPPGEGEQADIRYQWISSANATDWSDVVGATAENYQPAVQTQTNYFARIVKSGSQDACVDTSVFVEILNISLIGNNTISETHTICEEDEADQLSGSNPTGGYDGVQFSYVWESNTGTGWIQVDSSGSKIEYEPGTITDTTWYRRVVGSGGAARNVCISISNTDTVNVLPSITNNTITTTDNLLCQDDLLKDLNGATPGGGATQGGTDPTRIYQWELTTGYGTPDWQVVSNGPGEKDYTDNPQLTDSLDRFYRRIVLSGSAQECTSTSDTIHVTIHTEIVANTIEPFDSVCFADTRLLTGITPQGEPGEESLYNWRALDSGNDNPGSPEEFLSGPYEALGNYQYERVVNIGACADTSNVMTVTVMQLPRGHISGDYPQSCEVEVDLDIGLNVADLDTYMLPWQVYLKNGRESGIGPYTMSESGQVPVTLQTAEDSTQLNYEIESITYQSMEGRYTCSASPDSLSGLVPILVFRNPVPIITVNDEVLDSLEVCATTLTLEADPDHGTGRWTFDPPEYITASQAGGTNYDISIDDAPGSFNSLKYVATFTSTAGVCDGTDVIELNYFEEPAPAFAGEDTFLFLIDEVRLNADPPTAGIGTWAPDPESGPGIIDDEHDPKTLVTNLSIEQENNFKWTVTNGVCLSDDDFAVVYRVEVKRYNGFSPNGDMENEYYIMQGLKYADEYSITFFSSLGNLVRTITQDNVDELQVDPSLIQNGLREDESVVWDGLSENGSLVPSGTYYFVVRYIMHQRDPETGNIIDTDTYEYSDYTVVLHD